MNEEKRNILIGKAQAVRDLLDGVINSLKAGEDADFTDTELKIFGLITEVNSVRIRTLLGEVQDSSQKARHMIEGVVEEMSATAKSWLDTAAKTAGEALDKLSGISETQMRAQTFTPRFNARFREELRKRCWDDAGIDTALAVLYQILSEDQAE